MPRPGPTGAGGASTAPSKLAWAWCSLDLRGQARPPGQPARPGGRAAAQGLSASGWWQNLVSVPGQWPGGSRTRQRAHFGAGVCHGPMVPSGSFRGPGPFKNLNQNQDPTAAPTEHPRPFIGGCACSLRMTAAHGPVTSMDTTTASGRSYRQSTRPNDAAPSSCCRPKVAPSSAIPAACAVHRVWMPGTR